MACAAAKVAATKERLHARVEQGEFYEAHQMYQTLYHRHMNLKQHSEAEQLLLDGVRIMLKFSQPSSAADLLGTLVAHFKTTETRVVDAVATLKEVLDLFNHHPAVTKPLTAALAWAKSADPTAPLDSWRLILARTQWAQSDYSEAHTQFIQCANEEFMTPYAQLLIEWHAKEATESEAGEFVCRPVLKLLTTQSVRLASKLLTEYAQHHPHIKTTSPPFPFPLINFLYFLTKTLERQGTVELFNELRTRYAAHLAVDTEYARYLQLIGTRFFGLQPAANASGGLNQLLGSLTQQFEALAGADEDDDDDELYDNAAEAPLD